LNCVNHVIESISTLQYKSLMDGFSPSISTEILDCGGKYESVRCILLNQDFVYFDGAKTPY